MTRLEASAWPLAGGSACVFALAVILDRLPWQVALVAVTPAVAVWAWQSPVVVSAAIGGVAWMCVTGFDVHRFGDIRITGSDDVVRAAVLVLAGVLVASARAVAEVRSRHRRADPVWVEFHATGPVHPPGPSAELPRRYGAVRLGRRPPVRTDKEPSNGRPGVRPADSRDLRAVRPGG